MSKPTALATLAQRALMAAFALHASQERTAAGMPPARVVWQIQTRQQEVGRWLIVNAIQATRDPTVGYAQRVHPASGLS